MKGVQGNFTSTTNFTLLLESLLLRSDIILLKQISVGVLDSN